MSKRAKKTIAGETVYRNFSDETWKRLGKNKSGWTLAPGKGGETKKPIEVIGGEEKKEEVKKVEGIENITVADVIVHLKTLNTKEEVEAYVGKDERAGVIKATAKRVAEIAEKK